MLFACLALCAALTPHPAPVLSGTSVPLPVQDPDVQAEYEKKLAAAEGNIEELWKLHNWCNSYGLSKEARKVARKILKLDKDHRKANEALGHVYYDGRWFTTEKKLAQYKAKEEERIAKEKGLVKWEGEWVDPADVPFLEKGLVKTDDGRWIDKEEKKRLDEGWGRQDLTWIPPDELSKIDEGLWKCGDEWLSLEKANEYHSSIDSWWSIPSARFVLYTSCDRGTALQAFEPMEGAFRDLVRIYGVVPSEVLNVGLVRSLDQYNQFSGDDPLGTSGMYGAYFPVHWYDTAERKFYGGGLGYWDASTGDGNRWGPMYARFAVGMSFGQAIDPSPKTLQKFSKARSGELDLDAFYGEKRVPAWFRYGASSYASRYWIDPNPGVDKAWARKWSVENILRRGGLSSLDDIFAFELNFADGQARDASSKMLNEAGLLIAFAIDGDVAAVKQAHNAVKDALKNAKKLDKPMKEFQKALKDHEAELRAFAGI